MAAITKIAMEGFKLQLVNTLVGQVVVFKSAATSETYVEAILSVEGGLH